jgi:exocyst complex component 4
MDTDTKVMNQDLGAYEQTLTQAMQTHVPGLVALTENGVQARLAVTNLNEDGSTTIRNHRLLVPANPFNASILFQPYLAFITSAKETIDLNSTEEDDSSIGTFMDEFIQRVYLPQLEEKVTNLFQQAVNGETHLSHCSAGSLSMI